MICMHNVPSYYERRICIHIKHAFTRHGPYPQRLSDWSLGPQPSWGWFQYLHASSEPGFPPGPDTDWPATLTTLSGLKAPQEDTSQDHASAADSSDATREPDSTVHVHLSAERAATAMFVDSHNTGFYINSYTTKVNPGMDGVMDKLTAGLRRLFARWEDEAEETKTKADSAVLMHHLRQHCLEVLPQRLRVARTSVGRCKCSRNSSLPSGVRPGRAAQK